MAIRPFWDFRDELTAHNRIIVKGQTIAVPTSLRRKYLELAHSAHQGADSCIKRARQSIFWPGITKDIRVAMEKCEICARAAPRQEREALQQPITPEKAWSRVSVDMMTLDGRVIT